MEKYQKIEKLGEGSYGIVFKAQNKITSEIVALKRIRLDNEEEGVPCTAIREISLLKELKHPNIVSLKDVLHTEKKLTLVFEYMDSDLRKFMDICGGDLDSPTIKRGELKITDFGLARASSIPVSSYSHEVVTLWYRAPDILMGSRKYAEDVDMWSVGCIFGEISTARPLFPGTSINDQLLKIFKILGTPIDESLDKYLYDSHHSSDQNEQTKNVNTHSAGVTQLTHSHSNHKIAKDKRYWPHVNELPGWKSDFPVYTRLPLSPLLPKLNNAGIDLFQSFLEFIPQNRVSAEQALKHPYFDSLRQNQ
ncbi:hypothetical protein BB560_003384 [Smittium megazygosporum]|uniref:Protein kinase domain-containing protein n=1 Tax=Smittium megazygosporum TaxID=133381 RepID=A0A2T9ZC57_9FUNG|nr:hypothetical protein BB560_003384 [Smittium megazygosporum]